MKTRLCQTGRQEEAIMDLEQCYRTISEAATEHGLEPLEPLSDHEATAVLDLARVVAHAVERKAAPLVCYSLGQVLGDADAKVRTALLADFITRIEKAGGSTSGA